ncbi:MAG: hypothetical protein GY777_05790 [Candidatus Brocadiaceae bacterium]|nr:hypothetical protein [Candidatus Brocadiaceae bacterium]
MRGSIMDVHGSGSQRSDPKTGNPRSRGPQGDMIRVRNYIRCVRGGSVKLATGTSTGNISKYPDGVKKIPSAKLKEPRNLKGKTNPRPGRNRFVERLDRDGDGKVSRSEFDGPKDRFGFHDKNNDGYLSEDEAPKGPPPRGGRPPRP